MVNLYCRFCAEPKNSDDLLNLDCDESKCKEICLKLSCLNATYVDVLNSDILPKIVCSVCYDSLNNAYVFLDQLKKAQWKLKLLADCFPNDDDSKFDSDNTAASEETHILLEVKEETSELKDDNSKSDVDDNQVDASEDFFNGTHDVPEVKHTPKELESSSDVNVIIEPKEQVHIQLIDDIPVYKETIYIQDNLDSQKINYIHTKQVLDTPLIEKRLESAKELCEEDKTKSWKEYVWACALCDVELSDLDIFRWHCKAKHKVCAAFTCSDCEKTLNFDSFDAFVEHVRRHKKGLRNLCHYCDETVELEILETHVKEHSNNLVGCQTCGDILPSEEALRQHMDVKKYMEFKPKTQKPSTLTVEELTCDVCKRVYKTKSSLRDHKRHLHSNNLSTSVPVEILTCHVCKRVYKTKSSLGEHKRNVHYKNPGTSIPVEILTCHVCKKVYKTKKSLRDHQRKMHSNKPVTSVPVEMLTCHVCKKVYKTKKSLRDHQRKMHSKKPVTSIHVETLTCHVCKKVYKTKKNLRDHQRKMHNKNPGTSVPVEILTCHVCKKVCKNRNSLRNHKKIMHSE